MHITKNFKLLKLFVTSDRKSSQSLHDCQPVMHRAPVPTLCCLKCFMKSPHSNTNASNFCLEAYHFVIMPGSLGVCTFLCSTVACCSAHTVFSKSNTDRYNQHVWSMQNARMRCEYHISLVFSLLQMFMMSTSLWINSLVLSYLYNVFNVISFEFCC